VANIQKRIKGMLPKGAEVVSVNPSVEIKERKNSVRMIQVVYNYQGKVFRMQIKGNVSGLY
jgi:hypothetical protein